METDRMERIKTLGYDYERQTKEFVDQCNMCGGDYFVQISHADRYGYAVAAFACAQCGLVFLTRE